MTKAINECKPFLEVEKQVCSLPLAIKLKNLGVNQETIFYYEASKDKRQDDEGKWRPTHYDITARNKHDITAFAAEWGYKRFISAYTVAELGELIKGFSPSYCSSTWSVWLGDCHIEDDNEANARAKVLIYLLENNLIDDYEKEN